MNGNKVWIVDDAKQLSHLCQTLPDKVGNLLVQEIVKGPESNIFLWCAYINSQGRISAEFTARKCRQYPPGFGSASLVVSESNNQVSSIASKFITGLGFKGIVAFEFKFDIDSGKYKLIEINPRPSLWFSASTSAGVYLIAEMIHDLFGLDSAPSCRQREGVTWKYTIKDIYSSLFYKFKSDFILPPPVMPSSTSWISRSEVVGTFGDPFPLLADVSLFIRKFIKRFFLFRRL